MPFHTEPIAETELGTLTAVADWISDTQRSLKRVSVEGVLKHGADFRDDEYLGDGDTLLHFNEPGFHAMCLRLGCRRELLERLETPALASQVLNDLLAQREVLETLSGDEFVIDQRTGTIIGLVSKTYVTYSNENFLKDITSRIGHLPKNEAFVLQEAYGINTALTMRFVSVQKHGVIKGPGGEGEDTSNLGLEFANSMVGNFSVRINYYLHRLICANGMMVPASESVNRVFHSGTKDSFQQRLDRCLQGVMRGLGQLDDILKILGSRRFDPPQLARNRSFSDQIFDVIPGTKQSLCEQGDLFLRYPQDVSAGEREKMRQAHDARLIEMIPTHYGGEHTNALFKGRYRDAATLFDFINIFTEQAKKHSPSRKLGIQEKAGALAKYIASNAKKF